MVVATGTPSGRVAGGGGAGADVSGWDPGTGVTAGAPGVGVGAEAAGGTVGGDGGGVDTNATVDFVVDDIIADAVEAAVVVVGLHSPLVEWAELTPTSCSVGPQLGCGEHVGSW